MGDYIKTLRVDNQELKDALQAYINHNDKKTEYVLFNVMFSNLCNLVLFKLGISEGHDIYPDLFNQAMFRCFLVLKHKKYDPNNKSLNPFSFFYTVIRNETLIELKKFHKYRKKEFCVDTFSTQEQNKRLK